MILLTRSPASVNAGFPGLFAHFPAPSRAPRPPPMSLTPDQLQRIATLARIDVGSDELREVTERLNQVLGLIDELQSVDTGGIVPMSHALDVQLSIRQRLRPDEVTETDRRDDYQKGAPAVEDGLYLVPKVIE
jgi:aspartyl-tRNA(Asn)/glutamyl-tRNA(Gln) amidotransferase subunit C